MSLIKELIVQERLEVQSEGSDEVHSLPFFFNYPYATLSEKQIFVREI